MASLNFAPQTLTSAPHMLYHFRNLPVALGLLFKTFKTVVAISVGLYESSSAPSLMKFRIDRLVYGTH